MKKILILALAVLLFIPIMASCGAGGESGNAAGDVITLSVGTYSPRNSADGVAMEFFKQYVEEKSEGAIKVNLFHNSQLGDTDTQIEGVMMGSQDLFLVGIDTLAQWAPEIKFCSVPYLFRDNEHLKSYLDSDLFAPAIEKLADNNVIFLNKAWNYVDGPYRVVVSTKPIESLNDLKGLKMRVPGVQMLQETWKELGAIPVTVDYSEIYLALEQGLAESVEIPMINVRENSYCEVAKYVIKTDTFPQRTALIMNQSKFEGLTEDLQNILSEGAFEAGALYSETILDGVDSDIAYLKEDLGVTFIDVDLAPFREVIKLAYPKWEQSGILEPGVIDQILAL